MSAPVGRRVARGAIMSVLGFSHRGAPWRRAWSELSEDRFTDSDLVMFVGAFVITGLIGALTVAVLLH